ncbi:acyloxyacyl hydrolase [Massilia forsythiae]|uniref:Lipid A deacylase n=1 Tax=Massilia forsythiae TaxID=2728020 RepID=A0A7Z2ZSI7_9BURK|nr:acyloxyacyl hydrolase [Massilia forsythiae]QJE00265.1 acyloxyacyl hydrolase [Massilia forsythiae]
MVSSKKLVMSLAAVAALGVSQASFAADGWYDSVALEGGGGEHVQVVRLSAQKNWNRNWLPTAGYHLSGYWDANVAYWRANRWDDVAGRRKNLAVIGITPVFRWEADDKLGLYGEAGIGASVFSSVYRNTHRQLSTAYEFADHVGVGYVLPNKWDIGVRIQHYSNGGIKHPNGGVNLALVRAAYQF